MRSNDLDKQEIIKCFHCGNETPMPKVGEYSWGSRDLEYSDIDFLNKYELFACPVCHKVTLRHSYGDETMIHYHNYDEISYYDEKSILYPQNSIDSNSVPPKVKEAYEAALKTKSIDKYVCLISNGVVFVAVSDNGKSFLYFLLAGQTIFIFQIEHEII